MRARTSPPWTSSPTHASARCSPSTPDGRPSRSCSSTASWSAAATSSPSCTRAASSRSSSTALHSAAVVGGGVIGLSAARALRLDGFDVTVYEQHRVGTPRGSSPGRSRIYRTSYRVDDYVRLGRLAIEEWQRVDRSLLLRNGLLEHGTGVGLHAEALERCGEPFEWLEPEEAQRVFPEARFHEPVLWTRDAGAVLADDALRRLREGVTVVEGTRIDDPRELEADVTVVCP